MEKMTNELKGFIGNDRKIWTKTMFKIMGTIYRGVTNDRFTLEEGLNAMYRFGGTN